MPRKTLTRILALILFLSLLWLPTGRASADMAPKPELYFHFSLPEGLTIEQAILLDCKDDACLETEPIEAMQDLHCETGHCHTMIYIPVDILQLQVSFSDGQTRLSNPFQYDYLRNIYTVRVQETDLAVRQQLASSNNVNCACLCLIAPMMFIGVRLLATSKEKIEYNHYQQRPLSKSIGWYILGGILAILALALGALATWALPTNLLIETTIAILYWRFYWKNKKQWTEMQGQTAKHHVYTLENRPAWQALLTTVLIINLISQPLLWIIVSLASSLWGVPLFGLVLLLEVGVWLLEAWLLRLLLQQHLCWRDALELSLFMNLTSFGIGLLLAL